MMSTCGTAPENTTPDVPSCQPQMPVLAELLCSELSGNDFPDSERCDDDCRDGPRSIFDPAILHHPHVMKNLRSLEMMMREPKNYFAASTKCEILPYMRKVVGSWMLEVSLIF